MQSFHRSPIITAIINDLGFSSFGPLKCGRDSGKFRSAGNSFQFSNSWSNRDMSHFVKILSTSIMTHGNMLIPPHYLLSRSFFHVTIPSKNIEKELWIGKEM